MVDGAGKRVGSGLTTFFSSKHRFRPVENMCLIDCTSHMVPEGLESTAVGDFMYNIFLTFEPVSLLFNKKSLKTKIHTCNGSKKISLRL